MGDYYSAKDRRRSSLLLPLCMLAGAVLTALLLITLEGLIVHAEYPRAWAILRGGRP